MSTNMRKYGLLLLLFVMMLALPSYTQAAQSTKIIVDGTTLTLPPNVEVKNINKSVMIPIRVVVEHLGFAVDWEKKSQTIRLSDGQSTLELSVGSNTSTVNGKKTKLSSAPVVHKETALVPLRFVGEQFGLNVKWDNNNKTVLIKTPQPKDDVDKGTDPNKEKVDQSITRINSIHFMENRLLVEVDGKVKPKVFTMTEPDRIVMDIPYTEFSPAFIEGQAVNDTAKWQGQLDIIVDNPHVTNVRYSLFDAKTSTIRVVVDTSTSFGYNMVENGENGWVIMELNAGDTQVPPTTTTPTTDPETPTTETTPPATNNGKKIIVIDAGHGLQDSGSTSVSGHVEKEFTLSLALKVEALLAKEENIQVVMTRIDDSYPTRKERAEMANRLNAAAFISIHANSFKQNPKVSGTETYYRTDDQLPLAKIMHKHMLKATGFKDRKVKYENFEVLRVAKVPATLLEIGFHSNKEEESIMYTEEFQDRVAQGIVDGIKEFLAQPTKSTK